MRSSFGVDQEISTLREIYSIVFPGQSIQIILDGRPESGPDGPVEILDQHDIEARSTSEHAAIFRVGPDTAPLRTFLIAAPLSGETPEPQAGTGTLKRLRAWLIAKAPMLFECGKFGFMELDDLRHRVANLLRRRKVLPPKGLALRDSPGAPSRILLAVHWLAVGGAEAFAAQVAAFASRQGIEFWVVAQKASKIFYEGVREASRGYFELDRQLPREYHSKFLAGLCRKYDIDLLHNHHNTAVYSALPILRRELPALFVADSLHILERARYGEGLPGLSVLWTAYIDMHHAVSSTLARRLEQANVSPGKIRVGHLGDDLPDQVQFRIAGSLEQRRLRICFVGRMTSQKRPLLAAQMLVSAMKSGAGHAVEVMADVVGEGAFRKEFEGLVDRAGRAASVTFHPAGSDIPSIMKRADLLLISSDNEGLTLVAFEAYRAGCLVVSCDVGAQHEFVPADLLLPRSPWRALRAWTQLIERMMKDHAFVRHAIDTTLAQARQFRRLDSAQDLLARLYGGSR